MTYIFLKIYICIYFLQFLIACTYDQKLLFSKAKNITQNIKFVHNHVEISHKYDCCNEAFVAN